MYVEVGRFAFNPQAPHDQKKFRGDQEEFTDGWLIMFEVQPNRNLLPDITFKYKPSENECNVFSSVHFHDEFCALLTVEVHYGSS